MKLIQSIFNTDQTQVVYIIKAGLIAFVPAIILSYMVNITFPNATQPDLGDGFIIMFIGVVLFSPLLETLLMWPIVFVLGLMKRSTWITAILSALLWACLHSLSAPIWGITTFWTFVVFSIAFIEWRKISFSKAYWTTCFIHMFVNLIAFVLIQIDRIIEQSL